MAFFQNTVTDKYLNSLDKLKIQQKFVTFKEHFHNPEIQENIRNSKEEQYQEGFLRDLFVNILGYTLNPQNNFNLTTEYKNIKDSKKADGAIIIANKVLAVIELKGTETKYRIDYLFLEQGNPFEKQLYALPVEKRFSFENKEYEIIKFDWRN